MSKTHMECWKIELPEGYSRLVSSGKTRRGREDIEKAAKVRRYQVEECQTFSTGQKGIEKR